MSAQAVSLRRDQPAVPHSPPRLEISIVVRNDGQVIFCDLPPDLAQVRDVLAGIDPDAPQTTLLVGASEPEVCRVCARPGA